jgi:hypothetical protein
VTAITLWLVAEVRRRYLSADNHPDNRPDLLQRWRARRRRRAAACLARMAVTDGWAAQAAAATD